MVTQSTALAPAQTATKFIDSESDKFSPSWSGRYGPWWYNKLGEATGKWEEGKVPPGHGVEAKKKLPPLVTFKEGVEAPDGSGSETLYLEDDEVQKENDKVVLSDLLKAAVDVKFNAAYQKAIDAKLAAITKQTEKDKEAEIVKFKADQRKEAKLIAEPLNTAPTVGGKATHFPPK